MAARPSRRLARKARIVRARRNDDDDGDNDDVDDDELCVCKVYLSLR